MHAVCVILTRAVDVVRFIGLISPVHFLQETDMDRFFYVLRAVERILTVVRGMPVSS